MNNKEIMRRIGGCAIGLVFLLTSCGGSDEGSSAGGSAGGDGLCALVDTTALGGAVGNIEVEAVDTDPGCAFNGPGARSITTFDTVMRISLIEGDGATRFGPTSDDLGLGIVGSKLAENDSGWFSYSGVIGDQRLTVENGVNGDDEYYDSAELRTLAEKALTDWVAATS